MKECNVIDHGFEKKNWFFEKKNWKYRSEIIEKLLLAVLLSM